MAGQAGLWLLKRECSLLWGVALGYSRGCRQMVLCCQLRLQVVAVLTRSAWGSWFPCRSGTASR